MKIKSDICILMDKPPVYEKTTYGYTLEQDIDKIEYKPHQLTLATQYTIENNLHFLKIGTLCIRFSRYISDNVFHNVLDYTENVIEVSQEQWTPDLLWLYNQMIINTSFRMKLELHYTIAHLYVRKIDGDINKNVQYINIMDLPPKKTDEICNIL